MPFRTAIILIGLLGLPIIFSCHSASTFAGNTVNVLNYGAEGNGKHNDLPAINSAIAAAGPGGTVYFPGNHSYLVPGTINLGSVSGLGDGNKPVILSGFTHSTNDCLISATGSASITLLTISNPNSSVVCGGILVQNTSGPYSIKQDAVEGYFGNGISVINANNVTISNNTLNNNGASGAYDDISFQGCDTLTISGNTFGSEANVQFAYNINSIPFQTTKSSSNVIITNNQFLSNVLTSIQLSNLSSSQITHNTFVSLPTTINEQFFCQGLISLYILAGL